MLEYHEIGQECIRVRRLMEEKRQGGLSPAGEAEQERAVERLNELRGGDLMSQLVRIKQSSGILIL